MTGWYEFSNVNSSKLLRFYSVAEAHGLIYPRGEGGGGNSNLFIRGCAILALNIAPINPAALPKKDTHKSGKQEPHKVLTTVSSMKKAGKIILRQFFSNVYP